MNYQWFSVKDIETIESAFNDMLTGKFNSRKDYACRYLAKARALMSKAGLTCMDTFMSTIAGQIAIMRVYFELY